MKKKVQKKINDNKERAYVRLLLFKFIFRFKRVVKFEIYIAEFRKEKEENGEDLLYRSWICRWSDHGFDSTEMPLY